MSNNPTKANTKVNATMKIIPRLCLDFLS
uniref:Leucine-rich repeat transmembrane protein kinase n=1 Tax=Rhizophora mucronata TaxID=61149 RepID=A0A2P2Q925_RHIMU